MGDGSRPVHGVATLATAGPEELSFLGNRRYRAQLRDTRAAAVLLTEDDVAECPVDAIVVPDPYLAYARVADRFDPRDGGETGISPAAAVDETAGIAPSASVGPGSVIGPGVRIGADARIGPGCVLEPGVAVGEGSRLVANVCLYRGTSLGRRCLVHAGAVVGSDGFGFANEGGRWVKVPQLGGVRVGDDVEIGANTTIDRGAIEDTVIEDGVKLDNQIQIAHNVRVGAHTAMAGCVGVAGSTVIGSGCAIGGGVGILGHLNITDGVTVTAMSLVTRSITEPGVYSSGTPLERNDRWHRNFVRFKQLDDMARRLKALERELAELKKG